MRKSLSILLVVSLVLSLFAGFAVPTASAAGTLDKAVASYKYVNPYVGPTASVPVTGSGSWTITTAATKLSTYIMGNYIDGSVISTDPANGIVEIRDLSGTVIETTNYAARRFRVATAGVRADGVYEIWTGVDHASATLLKQVLIKYIWELDQTAMTFCKTNYISGSLRHGDNSGASNARVAVFFPNLDYVVSATVNNYGQFGMTIGPDAVGEYQRGLYTVVVIDDYPTVVNGATQTPPNVDSIVYAQLSTTTLKWTLDTYLSCTILYEHAAGNQPFVLGLFDDAGNPIDATTPTLAWDYAGTFAPSAAPEEIARGYYLFVGTPAAGAPYVQITASATIGGVAVSATKNIPVTPLTEWNPQVLVTTDESILQGDGYRLMGKTVYDKLPCTIGNSLNVFTVVYEPKNTASAKYELNYAKTTVSDSKILKKVGTIGLSDFPWENESIDRSFGAKYFIKQAGKISVHIAGEVWQMADNSCNTFADGRNACCLPRTFDCTVCEFPTCTVDKVEQVLNTDGTYDVKITIGGDPNSVLSCEICNKIIVDIVALDVQGRVDTAFGTNGHIWYNPIVSTENNQNTGIEDLPNYPADPFGATNVEFTNVGNTLVLKNVDISGFCTDTFAVWVYGTKKVTGCGAVNWIHPAIFVDSGKLESAYATTKLTGTADVTKLVAGVCQKVNLSGVTFAGTPAWTTYIDGDPTGMQYVPVSLGNGNWVVNFDPALFAAGEVLIEGEYWNNSACTYQYVDFTFEVLMPEFTVEIGLKDGTKIANDHILTEGLEERVYVTAKNPLTGAEIKPTELSASAVYCDCDIPSCVVQWWHPAGCEGISPISIVGLDNPNIACDPQVEVYFTACGADLLVDTFTFKKPTIAVTPDKDIPFYGCATCGDATNLTFKMVDAHQHGVPDEAISVTDSFSTYFGTAFTGTDGMVIFRFKPDYAGHYYVTLFGNTGYVVADIPAVGFWGDYSPCVFDKWVAPLSAATLQTISTVYKAPEKDTTNPVITITAGVDGSTVGVPTFTLTGKVSDNVGVLNLTVGNQFTDILPDGSFSKALTLNEGLNTISVKAYDAAGNVGEATVKVTYKKPVDTSTTIVLTVGLDIVTVNGKATSISVAPEIVNSRTFVPFRFIGEAFGATVDWLAETQGVTMTLGDHTVGLQIGNMTAVIDGDIVSLDAAPYIKNGRTMVPLRVISEAFGGNVAWDPMARTITIVYVP